MKPPKKTTDCRKCVHNPDYGERIHLTLCDAMADMVLVSALGTNCPKFQYVPGADLDEDES